MRFDYSPKGVCSMKISFDLEDGIVKNVKFLGGCSGNTQGVALLAEGRPAEELVSLLKGIKCGFKQTSCPDQLAEAIQSAINE
ncbi:MAG: TIGR03905 family TSCPD domain-containing protein [Clostridia bacterium]|nr:TIGR03905 family TSCPD domain-containing protein [Clostridia bacterium]